MHLYDLFQKLNTPGLLYEHGTLKVFISVDVEKLNLQVAVLHPSVLTAAMSFE